ncbi:MAG: AAA family ATPase [Myxococcales bacterium]|nr:AAA family ATPase [Myxococcales bacterium]
MSAACLRCSTENRPGRRFCAACGAPLPVACARCGFVNQPDERFCGGCGADGARPVVRAAPRGELRRVVVLFADLAGYTQLSGRLAPEDTHRMLGRFFDEVDGVVAAHGGTIDKHIGDNVMALFGAPIAHGNDAERAVRAALAIHARVDALGATLGLPLRVSVGVAGGEVMASQLGSEHHTEYTVIGSSVNLAARLQGHARAGETLVDDGVHRAVATVADAERLDELTLKGIDRPVRAWRVRGLAALPARAAHPLFGRDAELARLTAAIAGAADGRGQVVVVRGDAGLGKSRLVAEAAAHAAAHAVAVQRIAFVDFGGATRHVAHALAPLIDDAWLARTEAAAPQRFAALGAVLGRPLPPELRARHHALDVRSRAAAWRDAVAAAVIDAAARAPRLLVIEDLHWCPREELPLIAGLIDATAAAPVTVLITSRPDADLLGASAPWRDAPVAPIELDLAPLADADAARLAAALGAPAALADQAIARAGGNPLFLEELVAAADEQPGALPGTIHSLVLARLDRLSPDDHEAAQVASVLGAAFALAALRAMLGDAAYAPTALIERGILTDGDPLGFRHALIRDGAYASLPRDRRRALHARAAAVVGADDGLLRARHLDQADDPGAVAAYLDAAAGEVRALRLESARGLLERAAAIAVGPARCAVELARGELAVDAGRHHDALAAYRAAATTATTAEQHARAALGEAAAHRALSAYQPGLDALARADQALADDDAGLAGAATELRAWVHYQRASLYFAMSRLEASWAEAERAQRLAADGGSPALRSRALSALGDAAYATRTFAEARDAFDRTLALCDAHGMDRYAIPNRIMLAQCYFWLGDRARADALGQRALADALEIRHGFGVMFARHSLALFAQVDGELNRAEHELRAALALARELGTLRFEIELTTQLAEIELARGGDAAAAVRDSARLAEARGVAAYIGPWTYGVLALATGDAAERRSALAAGEALIARGTMHFNAILFHRLAALAHQRAAEPAAAARHARACLDVLAATGAVCFRDEMAAVLDANPTPT